MKLLRPLHWPDIPLIIWFVGLVDPPEVDNVAAMLWAKPLQAVGAGERREDSTRLPVPLRPLRALQDPLVPVDGLEIGGCLLLPLPTAMQLPESS